MKKLDRFIGVRVPPALAAQLRGVAAVRGESISSVIRKCLKQLEGEQR